MRKKFGAAKGKLTVTEEKFPVGEEKRRHWGGDPQCTKINLRKKNRTGVS